MSALPPDAPTGETPASATDADVREGQEPVAWRYRFVNAKLWSYTNDASIVLPEAVIEPLYAAPQTTPSSHARGVADDYVRQAGAELNLNRIEIARLRREVAHARRVALEEAARVCDERGAIYRTAAVEAKSLGEESCRASWQGMADGAASAANAIRALSSQPVRPGDGVRDAMALAVHNARYASPRDPNRTPDPFTDKGDREYAYRLTDAALKTAGLLDD